MCTNNKITLKHLDVTELVAMSQSSSWCFFEFAFRTLRCTLSSGAGKISKSNLSELHAKIHRAYYLQGYEREAETWAYYQHVTSSLFLCRDCPASEHHATLSPFCVCAE